MLGYTVVSYMLLRRKVASAVILRNNIYQSEHVISPFVLGIIRPKIYVPFKIFRIKITVITCIQRIVNRFAVIGI